MRSETAVATNGNGKGQPHDGPLFETAARTVTSSISLRPETWAQLDEVAEFLAEANQKADRLPPRSTVSRSEVAQQFLDWAINRHWKRLGGAPLNKKSWAERIDSEVARLKTARGR